MEELFDTLCDGVKQVALQGDGQGMQSMEDTGDGMQEEEGQAEDAMDTGA